MKVRDLIDHLLECHMDSDVVIQLSHDGGFTHHDLLIQTSGHPGHSGPVIHHGMQIGNDEKADPKALANPRGRG